MTPQATDEEVASVFVKSIDYGNVEDIEMTVMDVVNLTSTYSKLKTNMVSHPYVDIVHGSTIHKVCVALTKNPCYTKVVASKNVFDWDALEVSPDARGVSYVRDVPHAIAMHARDVILKNVVGMSREDGYDLTDLTAYDFEKLCRFIGIPEKSIKTLSSCYERDPLFCGTFVAGMVSRGISAEVQSQMQQLRVQGAGKPDAKIKAADDAGRSEAEVCALEAYREDMHVSAVRDSNSELSRDIPNKDIGDLVENYIRARMPGAPNHCAELANSVRAVISSLGDIEIGKLTLHAQQMMLNSAIASVVLFTFTSSAVGDVWYLDKVLDAIILKDEVQDLEKQEREAETGNAGEGPSGDRDRGKEKCAA